MNTSPLFDLDELEPEDVHPLIDFHSDGTATILTGDQGALAIQDALDAFNRKAARSGIDADAQVLTNRRVWLPIMDDGRIVGQEPRTEITLRYPTVRMPGWTLLGTLHNATGGTVARPVPGQDISWWSGDETGTDARYCDHCGTVRRRNSTFVVRHEDTGRLRQVGSSCLESYTGLSPTLSLSLNAWSEEAEKHAEPSRLHIDISEVNRASTHWSARHVVGLALVVSESGMQFVSRKEARNSPDGRVSTATRVNDLLTGTVDAAGWGIDERLADVDEDMITDVLDYARELDGHNDYAVRVRSLARGTAIHSFDVAILVSVLGSWAREKTLDNAPQRPASRGFVGQVGSRLTHLDLTVERVRYLSGPYGTTVMLAMRDAENHLLTWFASRMSHAVEPGDRLLLTGTVKRHHVYRGEDQTMITRCKIVERFRETPDVA